MKSKYSFLLAMVFFLSFLAMAQQPFAPAWQTQHARNFDPTNPGLVDPDWKFNKSTVPLQPRFSDQSIKANVQQFSNSQVANCLTWHMSCGTVPAQDALNFVGYNYNFWQYLDINIWWGGSAGEGIILPPSAPVTDASHLNGVKVLGQVFFPPTAYGGNPAWTNEFLETDAEGEYIFAKKLIEVARFYGFDGWFINEETKVAMGGTDNAKWEGWVNTFNKYKDPGMILQVYTMSTAVSPITNIWNKQDVSFFVNYGATGSAATNNTTYAVPAGVNHFEKFYYGFDIGGGGLSQGSGFRNLIGTTENKGSFDIFCAERQTWQPAVDAIRDSEKGTGTAAYTAWETVKTNESRFYVNINNDVTDLTQYTGVSWPGMATGIAERTSVMTKPFITTFSVGNGKKRVVNNVIKGTHDWYHRGMQEVLPTWRWWNEGPKTTTGTGTNTRVAYKLKPDFTYDDVYNGGSALQFKGILTAAADNLIRLYKTRLSIANGDKFQLIYKTSVTGSSCIELKLAFAEDANAFTTITIPAATSNDWTTYDLDLTPYAGKTISIIAFNFRSETEKTDYSATFGQMSIVPSSFAPTCSNISNLTVQNELKETTGDLRIVWDKATGDVHHYNVYLTRLGTTELVGQTRNEGFYYPKFQRASVAETSVSVTVIPVKTDLTESGSGLSVTKSFPDIQLPEIAMTADKTIIGTGVNVKFIATATSFPETYSWSFPESAGAVMVRESAKKDTVVYKFTNEGKVNVSCNVTNAKGTSSKTTEGLVEVSNTIQVKKVSCAPATKILSSSGAINTNEVEKYIIDCIPTGTGTGTKWCNGGLYEHWVILDLQSAYKVCKFVQYDSGVREDSAWNHKAYRIYTSNDLVNWDLVVDQKNRPESIKEDWCMPKTARYIKYCPRSEDEKITIRIYEFEVWGVEGPISVGSLADATLNKGETKHFQTIYSLGGSAKEANYGVTVSDVSGKNLLQVSNLVVSEENGTIDFDVTASNTTYDNVGSLLELKVTNGEWYATKSATLKILATWPNVMTSTAAWASSTYSTTSYPYSKLTDGIASTSSYWRATTPLVTSIDGTSSVHILLFNLAKKYDIYNFITKFYSATASYIPTKIGIYTTNDSVDLTSVTAAQLNTYTWTNLANVSPVTTSATQEFFFGNGITTGKFLRLDLFGGGSGYRISEIEAYGTENIPTGINKPETDDSSIRIYPTILKSGEYFTIEASAIAEIKIMSLGGETLKKYSIADGSTNIPTSGMTSGMYLITIKDANHAIITKKLLIK